MSKHLSDFRKSMSCSSNVNPIQVQKAESRWKDELLIFKSAVVGTISGDITFRNKEDMYELVAPSYSDGVIGSIDEYHQKKVERLTNECYRRCQAEHHRVADGTAVIPEHGIHLDLSTFVNTRFPDDDDISVKFDAILLDPGVTTGVIFRKGTPNISATSRGESNVHNSIELHLMMKALQKYADDTYKKDTRVNLVASIQFSAKTKDTSLKMDPLYFGKDEPVRAIRYTYVVGSGTLGDLDENLKSILDKFCAGCDASSMDEEKDCKGCWKNSYCHYKPAPEHQEIVEKVSTASKFQPSEEQQKILNSIYGVYEVNATAGSGKTAVTCNSMVGKAELSYQEALETYRQTSQLPAAAEYLCNDSRA